MKTKGNKETYTGSHKKTGIAKEPAVAYRSMPVLRNFAIKDDYSLIKKARQGVKTDVFYLLADTIKMPEKTLASIINLSPRTISNYREQEKHLDANYSEHLLKLINLYQFGKEIFGSFEEFDLWLHRPFWNSEEKPINLITTPGGVDLVYEEIEKLALGYPI
ncbi:DUF2384 domain-containing protein [Parapedobacter sp. SGR-10]|uniref:antitoxin Xre-like helix-turn-helix domain-containing protein n=1 Tax=Parapedobacter sp. SGR-10 TaxID=2710879 RepID=UPI0013D2BAED|nr:antitoxin Xre-like helix-turn-helix domain-containing protein [Parapedobacter sp. SGR-10]NGF56217.1 DUF2384 domain-containing protein [Parapedobacter sp. SGR-10]